MLYFTSCQAHPSSTRVCVLQTTRKDNEMALCSDQDLSLRYRVQRHHEKEHLPCTRYQIRLLSSFMLSSQATIRSISTRLAALPLVLLINFARTLALNTMISPMSRKVLTDSMYSP